MIVNNIMLSAAADTVICPITMEPTEKKHRFTLAHDSCASITYNANALATWLVGREDAPADPLTRKKYTYEELVWLSFCVSPCTGVRPQASTTTLAGALEYRFLDYFKRGTPAFEYKQEQHEIQRREEIEAEHRQLIRESRVHDAAYHEPWRPRVRWMRIHDDRDHAAGTVQRQQLQDLASVFTWLTQEPVSDIDADRVEFIAAAAPAPATD